MKYKKISFENTNNIYQIKKQVVSNKLNTVFGLVRIENTKVFNIILDLKTGVLLLDNAKGFSLYHIENYILSLINLKGIDYIEVSKEAIKKHGKITII